MRNLQSNTGENTRESTDNSRLLASVESERQADIAQLNIIENKLNDLETVRNEVENFAYEREQLENERERLLLKLDCTEGLDTLSDSGLSSYSDESNRGGLDSALVMQQLMALSIKLGALDATLKAQRAANLDLQQRVESQEKQITALKATNTNLTGELTQAKDEIMRTTSALEEAMENRKIEVDKQFEEGFQESIRIKADITKYSNEINRANDQLIDHTDKIKQIEEKATEIENKQSSSVSKILADIGTFSGNVNAVDGKVNRINTRLNNLNNGLLQVTMYAKSIKPTNEIPGRKTRWGRGQLEVVNEGNRTAYILTGGI